MKTLENIKFKKPSHITNGMAWMDLPIQIVKIVDENTCIDANGNSFLYNGKLNVGDVYECIVMDYYYDVHDINECYYKGKKVLTIENDYSHDYYKSNKKRDFDFIQQQVIYKQYPIKINCGKNNIKLNFERQNYITKLAIIKKLLSKNIDLTITPIKSVYDIGIGYNYNGGGYGEKYYLSNIYFFTNGFEKWLNETLKVPYLNPEFVKFCEYKDFYNYLINVENWDVVVESIPYEGYCVQGVKFIGCVEYVNSLLIKTINGFNKPIVKDFGL